MAYPFREDHVARDRRDQLERADRADRARPYYATTGVCGRRVEAWDVVGAVCPVCEHTDLVHPGFPNPGLDRCAICALRRSTAELDEVVTWIRSREDYP